MGEKLLFPSFFSFFMFAGQTQTKTKYTKMEQARKSQTQKTKNQKPKTKSQKIDKKKEKWTAQGAGGVGN